MQCILIRVNVQDCIPACFSLCFPEQDSLPMTDLYTNFSRAIACFLNVEKNTDMIQGSIVPLFGPSNGVISTDQT